MTRHSYCFLSTALIGLVLSLVAPIALQAQSRPVITRVTSAGSLAAEPGNYLAPEGIGTIFGTGLAASTQTTPGPSWPLTLGGVQVLIGGVPAALQYVSPTQINFQTPAHVLAQGYVVGEASIEVRNSGVASDPVLIGLRIAAPSLFTISGSGCGPGAVSNRSAEGGFTLNTPDQAAEPGQVVTVWLTGLGPTNSTPDPGQPAYIPQPSPPRGPPSSIALGVPWLGLDPYAFSPSAVRWYYSGRSVGSVGLDQVDFSLPDDVPEGCAVPLRIQSNDVRSQPVTISVRKGGGHCQDSVPASAGEVRLRNITEIGPDPGPPRTRTVAEAQFLRAPATLLPSVPPLRPSCSCYGTFLPAGPNECPVAGVSQPSAGVIQIAGSSGQPWRLTPRVSPGGDTTYGAVASASPPQSAADLTYSAEGQRWLLSTPPFRCLPRSAPPRSSLRARPSGGTNPFASNGPGAVRTHWSTCAWPRSSGAGRTGLTIANAPYVRTPASSSSNRSPSRLAARPSTNSLGCAATPWSMSKSPRPTPLFCSETTTASPPRGRRSGSTPV